MEEAVMTCAIAGLMSVILLAPVEADRLSDRDVKTIIERVSEGRDRFDDALDDALKRSVISSPLGSASLDRMLDDLDDNISRLKDRLKPDYAATLEAGTVLRQATAIDAFMRAQPAGTRGQSEWTRLDTDLKGLAAAYSATFPVTPGVNVVRMNDAEVAAAAETVAREAERLKGSLESDLRQDAKIDKATREAAVSEAETLSKDAKALRERVEDQDPSASELVRVLRQSTRLQKTISGRAVPTSAPIWAAMVPHVQKLAAAYGQSWMAEK
jgi:hypothetical protein